MRVGISTPSNEKITEELIKSIAEAGAQYIEISLNDSLMKGLDFKEVKKLCDKFGVTVWSVHLPFWPFDEIDISSPKLANNTLEYLKTYIDKGAEIGVCKYVIHASAEPIDISERDVRLQTAKNSLNELSLYAQKKGAVILVENLPRTCLGKNSDEILELLSANSNLFACFDTNHLLCEDYVKFIHSIGKKIKSTHVSDYDFKNERHWLPGEGQIDWQKLYGALKEVGYDGIWLYEVEFDAPSTIERDRLLCPRDMVLNASQIEKGERPLPIGTPKKDI